ncbi:MAG TPA: DMT family transporter [Candidatus Nanoarchaeia archaeon]
MNSQTSKGITLVFGTAVISGFAIFINSYGVKGFDPYLYTFLKNVVVALFLVGLLLGLKEFKQLKKLKRKDWLILAIIGLVGGCIPFLLFFKGLSMTAAASGAFIHKTMFIYVAVLAAVFLREKIPNRLFVAGALLLMGNLYFLKFLPVNFQVGDLLVLTATLFWAVENVISKYALKSLSPRIVAFGRMGIGAVFITAFLFFTGGFSTISSLTELHWQWVFISSVVLFGYVTTWYTGLKYINVSTATIILLLGSPITSLLVFIFQGQGFSVQQLIGTGLLVFGVGLAIGLRVIWETIRSLPKVVYAPRT